MKKYIILLLIYIVTASGQDISDSYLYQSTNTARAGISFQSIKVGENTISQTAFPVSVLIPFGNDLSISLVNNPALSKNDNTEINGLSETKIGLRYFTLDEKLIIKLITGLPTGKTKYSIDQFNLAKLLSTSALDYSVSFYGRGFNTNIGLSYAEQVSKSLILGLGVSYYYKGSFYPLELPSGGEYDPGDEVTIDLGIDYAFNRKTRFNLDVIYANYGKDKIDGTDKFLPAPRLTIYGGFQFNVDNTIHNIFIINRLKNDNTLYIQGEEFKASNGNQLDMGYSGIFPVNINLSLLAFLEGKMYGDIQQMVVGDLFETGKTDVYSAGAGVRIYLNEMLDLDITGKYKTGKINLIKGNIISENDVSGFGASAILKVRF
jgi:hypothetical protein